MLGEESTITGDLFSLLMRLSGNGAPCLGGGKITKFKGMSGHPTTGEPNNFRGAYGNTGQLACRSPLKSSL